MKTGVPYLIVDDGDPIPLRAGFHGGSDAGLADAPICKCGSNACGGRGRRIVGHDKYEADAECMECGAALGRISVRLSTLFGLEEDRRVLAGPWRVY